MIEAKYEFFRAKSFPYAEHELFILGGIYILYLLVPEHQ
jgi:hypothetical protein